MSLRLNDKPAVRIAATKIKNVGFCVLMDCEGDSVLFPDRYVKVEEGGTMLIEEWLYNEKVKDGEL